MFENISCVSAEAIADLRKVRSVYARMQRESWEHIDAINQAEAAIDIAARLDCYQRHQEQIRLCLRVLQGVQSEIRNALLQHGEEYFDVLNAFSDECQKWHEVVYKR